MKLIGAGLPRTATTTQMIALEMLGLPCYHMRDMMSDRATAVPQWRAALEGNGPWDELFEGKESVVDWPGSYHWRELMDVYPDAKVLLSVRSPESWVKSMGDTISQVFVGDTLMHHLARAQYHVDPDFAGWIDVMSDMWDASGVTVGGDEQKMASSMEEWNQKVIDAVPADRLLVWHPKDGWEPLCELLGLDVPDTPVPNVNDTENFQTNLIMGPAIEAINAWWEDNKGPADAATEQKMASSMEEWNQKVIDAVPADRLLVWHPKDGWEPLCDLLGLDVPDTPVPNVNDTENFQTNLIMGPAIEAINAWWEDNKGPADAATEQRAATA